MTPLESPDRLAGSPAPGPDAPNAAASRPCRDTRQRIGWRLRVLRAAGGDSVEAVAERAGLDPGYIRALEAEARVSLDDLPQVAEALGLAFWELLDPADWIIVRVGPDGLGRQATKDSRQVPSSIMGANSM